MEIDEIVTGALRENRIRAPLRPLVKRPAGGRGCRYFYASILCFGTREGETWKD
jgi:hypothetical protein